MRTRSAGFGLAMLLVVLVGGTAIGAERYEDAVGDALGDAPDIVAVTISEADNGPLFSIAVEFAEERPFGTDMETYTDVMFVGLGAAPDVDERGIMDDASTYLTGTHGVTLERDAEQGAHLVTPERMYWQVVDVAVDGPVVTFTLDRQLIDSPLDLYFQVLVGVERGEEAEGTDEGDTYPELDVPPAVYPLGSPAW
jgi:hypothetical protein